MFNFLHTKCRSHATALSIEKNNIYKLYLQEKGKLQDLQPELLTLKKTIEKLTKENVQLKKELAWQVQAAEKALLKVQDQLRAKEETQVVVTPAPDEKAPAQPNYKKVIEKHKKRKGK